MRRLCCEVTPWAWQERKQIARARTLLLWLGDEAGPEREGGIRTAATFEAAWSASRAFRADPASGSVVRARCSVGETRWSMTAASAACLRSVLRTAPRT